MNRNELILYTIAGIIILIMLVWILIKALKKNKSASKCDGCALTDTCVRPRRKKADKI